MVHTRRDTTPIFCFILSFFPFNDHRANATQSRIQEGARCPGAPHPLFRRLIGLIDFWATVINVVDTSATYLSETASSTGRARKHEKEAAAGIGHSCSSNFANVPGLMFLSPETGCQIRRPSVSTTRSLFHHRSDSQVPAMYLFSFFPTSRSSCSRRILS